MKGLIVLFVVGVSAALLTVAVLNKSANNDSQAFAIGFGDESGGQVEMDLVVGMLIAKNEPPRTDPESGTVYWDDWVTEHFQLYDSGRRSVPLKRISHSSLIPDHKAGGGAEFFLQARLTPGQEYTYVYIPLKDETRNYQWVFTAPSGRETRRPIFELVDLD